MIQIYPEKNNKVPFIITTSYFFSFLFIRLMVLLAGSANNEVAKSVKQGTANFNFYIGKNIILFGYHIHHFYFGVLLISIAGWFSIKGTDNFTTEKLAVMYGIGLGLFMDEIGLLLTDQYFSSLSYLLGLFLFGIFINIIYFPHFWQKVRSYIINKEFSTISILNIIFKNIIKILDITSRKILKYKTLIIILMIIFLILDYFLPSILNFIF